MYHFAVVCRQMHGRGISLSGQGKFDQEILCTIDRSWFSEIHLRKKCTAISQFQFVSSIRFDRIVCKILFVIIVHNISSDSLFFEYLNDLWNNEIIDQFILAISVHSIAWMILWLLISGKIGNQLHFIDCSKINFEAFAWEPNGDWISGNDDE